MKLNCNQIRQQMLTILSQFHSLDNSIYTNGSYAQRFSNFFNCLMVRAIHTQNWFAGYLSKYRTVQHFYLVYYVIFFVTSVVSQPFRHLAGDVHDQCPAQCHIEDLLPPAYAQKWPLLPKYLV